jgi:hypothetical protein
VVGPKNLANGKPAANAMFPGDLPGAHARKISHPPAKTAISGCIRNVNAISSAARQKRRSRTSMAASTLVMEESERGCRYWSKM